jgi:hypothetical protein
MVESVFIYSQFYLLYSKCHYSKIEVFLKVYNFGSVEIISHLIIPLITWILCEISEYLLTIGVRESTIDNSYHYHLGGSTYDV